MVVADRSGASNLSELLNRSASINLMQTSGKLSDFRRRELLLELLVSLLYILAKHQSVSLGDAHESIDRVRKNARQVGPYHYRIITSPNRKVHLSIVDLRIRKQL